jgi:G:T-mismatch repair DNA endonuclease (very short patch repair protein)
MAVFVHGCYWHRHPDCVKASTPKTNRRFWERKFERNQARDSEAVAALGTMGYRIAVIWECEVGDSNLVAKRLRSLERRASVSRRHHDGKLSSRSGVSSPSRGSSVPSSQRKSASFRRKYA